VYASTSQLIADVGYRDYNSNPEDGRFLASNNMTLPAESFAEIGGFDPSFFAAASEDRELCARWIAQGTRIVYAAELIIYHSHSMTFRGFCRQHRLAESRV
ncbi:MAG: glycosyl transferase, partial [Chloroflexi bacterium]|nr:glycosyl transferase [Chloroflexota bacterium]